MTVPPRSINRRDAAKLSAVLAGAVGFAGEAVAATDGAPILTYAFGITATLGPPLELGTVSGGRRRCIPITGGVVSGAELRGTLLPGGADWQTIGSDGVTEAHAHYAMRTHDGIAIEIDNIGVRVASADIIARLTAGEDLDPALYYFRTNPRFSPAAGSYDWLRRHLYVATGIRHPDRVVLKIFTVS